MKHKSGSIYSRVVMGICASLIGSTLHAQTIQTWDGGSGNYNAPLWNGGNPPFNANTIFTQITTSNSTVAVNGVFTVGELTLGSTDTLGINNGQIFNVDANGGFTGAGTITNQGAIVINSVANVTQLGATGAVSLTGGGTLTLNDNSRITSFATGTFTNVNNVIEGATGANGSIGDNHLDIVNQANGLINANVSGDVIVLDPGSANGLTNHGTMEASNGGILLFTDEGGGDFANTGGTIQALTGSQVQLTVGTIITGGTLTTAGTGTIHVVNTGTITDVTNAGTFIVDNSAVGAMSGTITNTGTMTVASTANATILEINGDTVLTGGGTLNMANNARLSGTGNLTNVNNIIQGDTNTSGGSIGDNHIGIINQASGIIDANVSAKVLVVDPSLTGNVTNTGLMEATGGGLLLLDGEGGGSFDNTGGTIKAVGAGSQVQLTNTASITGGTLTTSSSGTINNLSNATLTSLTNSGAFVGNNGSATTIAGTITNSGSITLATSGNNTRLEVLSPTTLTGGGTVNLTQDAIVEGNDVLTNVNNTIQGETSGGAGGLGRNAIGIINQANGVIDANVSAKVLVVDPSLTGNVTNTGLMESTGGGLLLLDGEGGGSFDNTGGTIKAVGAGSQVQLTNTASITGGTLTTSSSGTINNLSNATLTSLTNSGAFVGNNGSATTIAGTITNSGSITLATSGNNTRLEVLSPTTLTGGGTVNLTSMTIVEGNNILTNANNTIQGETSGTAGSFGGNAIGIVNQANGVIDANVSTKALIVDPSAAGNVTNTGLMEASNAGLLVLDGEGNGSFNNAGGTIQATGAGSQVQLTQGAIVTGGTLATASSGSINNLDTATLSGLTNSGAFVGNNGSATTIDGTINNTGSITLATSGNNTRLEVLSPTTLTGGGTVNLTSMTIVEGNNILTNANNTIQGETSGTAGSFGGNAIGIVNQASGIIDANISTKALIVDPSSTGNVTNTGLMEATNGGILLLTGEGSGTFNNAGGTIKASGAGSQVQLTQDASITGGTLATASSGTINNLDNASLSNLTNSGAFVGNNNTVTTISGTIHNTGSISLNSTGNFTQLQLNGDTTLSGGGTVNLVASDVINGTGKLTNAGNTIQGATATGNIGNTTLSILNQGVIDANINGERLTINPSGAADSFVNDVNGIVRASNGGLLLLTGGGGTFTNNGTFDAATGSTIQVDGTLIGTGLVTGNGTLMTPSFTSHGTITPGTGGHPGTLTLDGDYTQAADGKLVIQVNNTTPGTGFSVFNVTGTANLGGTLQLQSTGIFPGTQGQMLTFLTAGTAVNGNFLTLNNLSGINLSLVYNGDNVQLLIMQNTTGFDRPGLTPNQHATGAYIDSVIPTATGSVATLIGALNVVPVSGLPGALNQLSPQSLQVFRHIAFDNATFASAQNNNHQANLRDGLTGFDGSQLHATDTTLDPTLSQIKSRLLAWNPPALQGMMSDVTDPVIAGVDMKEQKLTYNQERVDHWSTFVAGDVILADVSHSDDVAHQDYTTGSVTLGADYQFDSHFTVGSLFAYGHTDATLDHIGSKATDDSYSPGIYASYVDGGWYANGLFSYGFNSYTSNRNIAIGSLTGSNDGAAQGNQYTTNLTGGYEFQQHAWKFGPVASLQYVHLDINSFTEQGPSALSIDSQDADSLRSQLGFEARYAAYVTGCFGPCALTPHVSATWQHEFMDNSNGITSQFNGTGAGSFTVQTEEIERDSAFIDAGLDAQVTNNVTLFTDYETQVGQSHFFAQSVQAGVKIGF